MERRREDLEQRGRGIGEHARSRREVEGVHVRVPQGHHTGGPATGGSLECAECGLQFDLEAAVRRHEREDHAR